MEDENDLSSTITAKSDQLNADDLVEAITITVTRVDKVSSKDQPVLIHSDGRQPFKPCLTMRRMLIAAWGKYKDEWVGRSMTVFCDPEVMWAGKEHGGIRVSHVTNIDGPVSKMLAVTRGRKKLFTLLPLNMSSGHEEIVSIYMSTPDGDGKTKLWEILSDKQKAAIQTAFNNL